MQLIAYILVYPILWLISILPFKLLYGFSDVIYLFMYLIFGYRKSVVKENLRLVFPDKSEKDIAEITSQFYHHFCDMMVEAIKSLTISEAQMKKRFKFTNVELINDQPTFIQHGFNQKEVVSLFMKVVVRLTTY